MGSKGSTMDATADPLATFTTPSSEAAPTAPAPPSPPPQVPLAIDYATPAARRAHALSPEANRLFWRAIRKIILAGGLGLFAWGVACLGAGIESHAAAFAVAWGVTFVALMSRFPPSVGRKRNKPIRGRSRRRRRSRLDQDHLNHEVTKGTKRCPTSGAARGTDG
jgi:hypothetical protein